MISKDYSPEKYQEIGKFLHGGIKPIISQIGELESSVKFNNATLFTKDCDMNLLSPFRRIFLGC